MTDTLTTALERSAMPREARNVLATVEQYRPLLVRYLGSENLALRAEADLRGYLRDKPALWECDPSLVAWAFLRCARLGLDLLRDEFAIAPCDKKPVPIVMYRGYCALAYRSGQVKEIHAHLVYEGEPWDEAAGSDPRLLHKIRRDLHDPEKIVAAYGMAKLATGGKVWQVIEEREWERARKSSPLGAKGKGPWAEHRPEMILKTALRRFAESGKLPLVPVLADALQTDEAEPEPPEEEQAGLVAEEPGEAKDDGGQA